MEILFTFLKFNVSSVFSEQMDKQGACVDFLVARDFISRPTSHARLQKNDAALKNRYTVSCKKVINILSRHTGTIFLEIFGFLLLFFFENSVSYQKKDGCDHAHSLKLLLACQTKK